MNLIIITTVLIIWGVLGLLVLNSLYKHTNAYQNQFIDICKFQNLTDENKFDIVNLGSNQPKFAFDYSALGVKGMNWAIGPQAFMYDFAILKKYKKHLNPFAKVIIPICPLSFFLYDTHFNNRLKYYRIFAETEMPDYNAQQKLKDYTLPIIFHPQRLRYILRDIKHDNLLSLTYNPMDDNQIALDARKWIECCWNPQFNIDIMDMQQLSDTNKRSIENNIQILSDMIQYCLDNGFKPIIVILPVTKYLSSKFSEDFIQNNIIKHINESNKNEVPILNYFKNERFSSPDLYFNSFFMNKTGRRIFTKYFIENIK